MANGETRGERLQIMLTADELVILDDFRYKQRMPSRASAIRELLKRGLAAEGFEFGRLRYQVRRFRCYWHELQKDGNALLGPAGTWLRVRPMSLNHWSR